MACPAAGHARPCRSAQLTCKAVDLVDDRTVRHTGAIGGAAINTLRVSQLWGRWPIITAALILTLASSGCSSRHHDPIVEVTVQTTVCSSHGTSCPLLRIPGAHVVISMGGTQLGSWTTDDTGVSRISYHGAQTAAQLTVAVPAWGPAAKITKPIQMPTGSAGLSVEMTFPALKYVPES